MEEEPKYVLPHDVSNALVLPSSKKSKEKSRTVDSKAKSKPILSKKKEKKLRKILERKQKRFSRKEVLEKLSQHQISQNELNLFSSVARIQQKVPKRKLNETGEEISRGLSCSSVAGSKRKKFIGTEISIDKSISSGPYFETDSSSDEGDSENDQSVKEIKEEPEKSTEIEILEEKSEIKEENIEKSPTDSKSPENLSKGTVKSNEIKNQPRKSCTFVPIFRKPEIQEARLKLPILGMEQEIMELINENPVVIVSGATGSGKTTQIPQFLYEAGFCSDWKKIGITEPRRVAAMSMSTRVAEEMSLDSSIVSYQIRYEGNVTMETKIKFMTDGVLLKELKSDFLLNEYSCVIIDEAHERSMYSDILIGLLSRVVLLREKKDLPPLKLIIMSATLRVDDFLTDKLFGKRKPPVINVESRQFPVTTHFSRRTDQNFLKEAFKKCCQIHQKLPDGGILVFLPGQREVRTLVSWLKAAFPENKQRKTAENEDLDQNLDEEDEKFLSRKKKIRRKKGQKPVEIKLDDYKIDINDTDATDGAIFGDKDDPLDLENDQEFLEEQKLMADFFPDQSKTSQPLHILPLYALLSAKNQSKVFEAPPVGSRLCVVATNVAETSLTISNVKYVVDSGKEKIRAYDSITGVSKFVVQWISKASAEQRTGRAGRTSPGHCYRLYSSAVFADFQQFSEPEILAKPIDDLVLTMKNMNILKIHNFPFPTAPDPDALRAAEQRLCKLGALQGSQERQEEPAKITPLGRTMAFFPVSPAFSKMLALGHQQNLLPYVVCIVSALSVREPLINLASLNAKDDKNLDNGPEKHENDQEKSTSSQEKTHFNQEKSNFGPENPNFGKEKLNSVIGDHLKLRREWAGSGESLFLGDISVLLRAVLDGERNYFELGYCEKHGLRQKAMLEIRKMRRQLTNLINGLFPESNLAMEPNLEPPDNQQAHLLRQILLSGLANNVAKKRLDFGQDGEKKSIKNAYDCATSMSDPVFIHPTSVLRKSMPDFVIYQEIIDSSNKKYMTTLTAVEPEWFSIAARAHCNFGPPLEEPQPWYDPIKDVILCKRSCTFGLQGWKLDDIEEPYPINDILQYTKYFSTSFLNGDIFNELKPYTKCLLSSPHTMLKPWAKLQSRTRSFLEALLTKNVKSKQDLKQIWAKNRSFLIEEYCQWLPESKHHEISIIWPPDD